MSELSSNKRHCVMFHRKSLFEFRFAGTSLDKRPRLLRLLSDIHIQKQPERKRRPGRASQKISTPSSFRPFRIQDLAVNF